MSAEVANPVVPVAATEENAEKVEEVAPATADAAKEETKSGDDVAKADSAAGDAAAPAAAAAPPAKVVPPKVTVHKADFEKDIIYLYQFSRTPFLPSISPYCLKVETWLRLAGLKYEVSAA